MFQGQLCSRDPELKLMGRQSRGDPGQSAAVPLLLPPAPSMGACAAQAARWRSRESPAHELHFRQSAGKIRVALVWSQGFPASPCRKGGSGINRLSSKREGGKEEMGKGSGGKGRRVRMEREEREKEKGRETKDNQRDEDRESQRRIWRQKQTEQ